MSARLFPVASVRAQSLADALTWVIVTGGRYEPFVERAVFEAQRLRSSCERSLGTRGRHYDGAVA